MTLDELFKPFEELADKYDCSKPSTLADHAGRALRQLVEQMKANPQIVQLTEGWVVTIDRFPRPHIEVQLWWRGELRTGYLHSAEDELWCVKGHSGYTFERPSHWRALPAPPQ